MIEPLRKMGSFGSRDEAEAARLLRGVGPAQPLPAVEQRVFASLGRPARLGPRAFRFASVASVSLVATGALALTVGVLFHQPAETRAPDSNLPMPTSSAPPAVAGLAAASPPAPLDLAAPSMPPPASVVTSDPPAPARAESRRPSRAAVARTSFVDRHKVQPADPVVAAAPQGAPAPAAEPVESTEARVAAAPSEEAALVLAGLRALRRQHDAHQAGVLLARYLSRYPQGVLRQEALALAIEAGLARGDDQAAAQLAKQYLAGFPAGRFARLARKAMDGTGP